MDSPFVAAVPAADALVREGKLKADDEASVHADLHRCDSFPVGVLILV